MSGGVDIDVWSPIWWDGDGDDLCVDIGISISVSVSTLISGVVDSDLCRYLYTDITICQHRYTDIRMQRYRCQCRYRLTVSILIIVV